MTQIITILQTKFNNEVKQTINARDLHETLEIKKDFSNWIKSQLEDFIENEDYLKTAEVSHAQKGEPELKGQNRIDYFLTLDTAKHIAMMSRATKGKEVRNYFIEVEKKLKELQTKHLTLPSTKELALMVVKAEEEKERLQEENKQLTFEILHLENEKSDLGNKVSVLSSIHEVEHDLRGLQECGTSLNLHPNKFIKKLRDLGYLKAGTPPLPYQVWIDKKIFVVKVISYKIYENDVLTEKATSQAYITKKGYIHFENLIAQYSGEWQAVANDDLRSKLKFEAQEKALRMGAMAVGR